MRRGVPVFMVGVLALLLGLAWVQSAAAATAPELKLINPKGIEFVEPIKMIPHAASLEGKTVVLRWNGKHNGDNFLTRIAELLTEKVKGVKIVKVWENDPDTSLEARAREPIVKGGAKEIAKRIASYKPDMVIASQAD